MFDIIKIGFLTISFVDIIDITIVTLLIYKLYTAIRGTIAAQIFFGLVLVLILSITAEALHFKAIGYLLKLISDIWVIAFIILFQPEIRRFLIMLGRNPFFHMFLNKQEDQHNMADILTESAFELAQYQHGALIVISKSSDLKSIVESGEEINSKLSKNLLRSIFFPRSPMHDGAVVIKNGIIEAARCTLPLSQETSIEGVGLGMRHRAGLGISEQAEVISLIVSEETGSISLAERGELIRGLSKDSLRNLLAFSLNVKKTKGWKSYFEHLKNYKKENTQDN